MVDGATLERLTSTHAAEGAAVTVLTARVANPTGYGRIVRDAATGDVIAIVEEKDAKAHHKAIDEINSSMYAFDAATLRRALAVLDRKNAQREVLLTDVIGKAREAGKVSRAFVAADPWAIEGVNDRVQLARLAKELNRRTVTAAMYAGVTIIDPETTWIDVGVTLERDVTLLPGTHLKAGTSIEAGAVVGPDSTLEATTVGAGATVNRVQAIGAVIGAGATVGPWTYLRPGTVLGARAKAGSFVEIKSADIGAGAKVPHLSYVGDATVGEGANIGAATIFANYDGMNKARTTVGRHAKVGSDTILVAPVTVGDGAYTGAGTVVREDVPAGALAVNEMKQRTIEGWVARRRLGTAAADAAGGSPSPFAGQPAVPGRPSAAITGGSGLANPPSPGGTDQPPVTITGEEGAGGPAARGGENRSADPHPTELPPPPTRE
jgi:bifunctional UDP-N-acetylglucosamine pyrophosphorylase/glucosamine-1-phosphate N-acetyltransferase